MGMALQRLGWLKDITGYHLLVFVGCWLGGIFDGMDSSLYMVTQFDALSDVLGTTDRSVISTAGSHIMATFLMGWVVGGLLFGIVGDRLGRIKAMVGSILLYSLFTGLTGLAHTEWQFALCRFLTGVGIGGELVTITTVIAETWPERSRTFAIGMLITSYQMGVFLAGLLPTVIYSVLSHVSAYPMLAGLAPVSPWRWVFMAGALPALLTVLIRLNLKEPERWTALHHSDSPTHHVTFQEGLQTVWGHLQTCFSPGHRRDLVIGGTVFGSLLIGYWASLAWVPTWIQDLLGPNQLGTEKSVATMIHGLAGTLGCFSAGLLAPMLGRRWTMVLGYGCSFCASAWLVQNSHFTSFIYVQYAVLGFFTSISQAIVYIYLPELFPTIIRATAIGFCLNVGRVVTAVLILFVGPLVALLGGFAPSIFVFSCAYLLAVVAACFARETNHQPLPE